MVSSKIVCGSWDHWEIGNDWVQSKAENYNNQSKTENYNNPGCLSEVMGGIVNVKSATLDLWNESR